MIDNKDLDKADSFLTKIGLIWKKHWLKILILLLCYGAYKFCCLVAEEMDKESVQEAPVEQSQPQYQVSPIQEGVQDVTTPENTYNNNQSNQSTDENISNEEDDRGIVPIDNPEDSL